jgi:hypothetical protein
MNPRWTIYTEVVNDYRDEEKLNDCFADLLDDTLTRGPALLNFLLDGIVEFEEGAEVIATDRDPLPFRSEGKDRKIDFTIGDDSKIVGFESKRKDHLKRSQLTDEYEKLEYNADGREPLLVAITEDLKEPGIISQVNGDIEWSSWFYLSQRLFEYDPSGEEWKPTVSRAQKMFREFGYTDIDGIDEKEFRVSVWELWKQIASQVSEIEPGERFPHKTIKEVKGTSRGWKPIDPDWMLLTYSNGSSGEHSETSLAVLSNKKTKQVWVGLSVRPWGDKELQEFMCDNSKALAERVLEEDMVVIQFPLNYLVGRKTLPEKHSKAVTAKQPSSKEELNEAFSDRKGMENDGANRFVIGYPVSTSNALEDSVESIHRVHELFDADDSLRLRQLIE